MAEVQIRDAIHTRIVVSDHEQAVLNHPYLQRLRFIRQLGFVPLVYPSATHDRLSHSLGTMHMAGLLAEQITSHPAASALARVLTPAEKKFFIRILRLAGLLHDVGHAPFSHSAELLMPPVSELAIPRNWLVDAHERRIATHEDYSVLMVTAMAEGPDSVLTPEDARIIASLIHHTKISVPPAWNTLFSRGTHARSIHALACSLISSNMDADRMDYLLRDSHGTGVPYGHFDSDWLISNLGVVLHGQEYILSMPETSILALEHYLFARYHMYTQVYMHKTAKCFEYYFQQALEHKELSYAIPADQDAFAQLRDSTLIESLFRAARETPDSWSGLLTRRIPAKRIARIWDNEKNAQNLLRSLKKDMARRGIEPFLAISRKNFLDIPRSKAQFPDGRQGIFLFGLAAIPIAIIRNQFGTRSLASLADSSLILKHYHRDISIADIYIPRDQYDAHTTFIRDRMKKYRIPALSEISLEEQ